MPATHGAVHDFRQIKRLHVGAFLTKNFNQDYFPAAAKRLATSSQLITFQMAAR